MTVGVAWVVAARWGGVVSRELERRCMLPKPRCWSWKTFSRRIRMDSRSIGSMKISAAKPRAGTRTKFKSSDGQKFLAVKDAGQRVKKRKIDWDPKAYPVLTWRWRLHKAPSGSEPIAALYASLDTDLLFIPVFTKYIWSAGSRRAPSSRVGCSAGRKWWCKAACCLSASGSKNELMSMKTSSAFISMSRQKRRGEFHLFAAPGVEIDFGTITVSSAK